MTRKPGFDVGYRTDVGKVRNHNEDSVGVMELADAAADAKRGRLYIVADGMGGHQAGDLASSLAIDTITSLFSDDSRAFDPATTLSEGIRAANERIHEMASDPNKHGMGTTIVGAIIKDGKLVVANVGDSRCYLIRDGRIRQVSQDHSWVAEAVAAGHLTTEQARVHPRRNAITRSVGTRPMVEPQVYPAQDFRPGDVLVLCSDGLSGQVEDEVIRQAVAGRPAQEAADKLVELANLTGGPDNITVIVVRNGPPPKRWALPLTLATAVVAGGLAVAGIVLFAFLGGSRALTGAIGGGELATVVAPDGSGGGGTVSGQRGPTSTPLPDSTSTPTPEPSATRSAASGGGAPTSTATRSSLPGSGGPFGGSQSTPQPAQSTATATRIAAVSTSIFVATNTPCPPSRPCDNKPPTGDDGGGDDGGNRR